MQIEVTYGNKNIYVDVAWGKRKHLSITVHPDLRITAKAPDGYAKEEIQARLKKKAPWIIKQLDYFEQYHPMQPARQYLAGETHYYLGKPYRLRITQGNRQRVRLVGRYYEMELRDPGNRKKAQELMQKWYLTHTKELLDVRVKEYLPCIEEYYVEKPVIRFRRMKKRWGSCSGDGVLLFNTELVKAPLACIDYVIVHELCHLVYAGHNETYYRLLQNIMPDWVARKQRLEKVELG